MTFRRFCRLLLFAALTVNIFAATLGKVTQIRGHASDIALDERRGLVYLANFTANRIEVISTSDLALREPISVPAQPGSLALSPDGRYLVVTHHGTWAGEASVAPTITILDLDGGSRRLLSAPAYPLAVGFGDSPLALVVLTDGFYTLDPAVAVLRRLQISSVGSMALPVDLATFPPEIVQASLGVSGDRQRIVGVAALDPEDLTVTVHFSYDVRSGGLTVYGISASPPLGPRVVSVDEHGTTSLRGWALIDEVRGSLLAEFPKATGALNVGSHAFDWARNLIYAQIPQVAAEEQAVQPELQVVDSDNLTVRERIRLPENLAGRSLLSSDHSMMYSISDSGLTALPVGSLDKAPRVSATREDLLFRGDFCDRRTLTQEVDIVDLGGGSVDFKLTTSMAGVTLSPSSGTTPARVKVSVDPNVYQNFKGTATGAIVITSNASVNVPPPIRVLINTREPDQRGTLFNVPGKLVDILADPVRDRFYVLRQDQNKVLVFRASDLQQISALRTGNTPTQMAMTFDNRWLLVANDNSQIVNRYDLDLLQPLPYIAMPGGHYARSVAASRNAVLVAVRSVAEPVGCPEGTGLHTIDRIDFNTLSASTLPSLGAYCNDIPLGTVLTSSPSGALIFAASDDGNVFLYEASSDTFVASRKDFGSLGGAFAALNDSTFVAGNHLLNQALVPYGLLETGTGSSSGFAILDGVGLRTTASSPSSPGVIQRVDLADWAAVWGVTKMIEAPVLVSGLAVPVDGPAGQTILPFTRTLAVSSNRSGIISLSTSGFVVLPLDFDAVLAKPAIQSVVNLADGTTAIASGGLIAVRGGELSPSTVSTTELPLPTTLGEACLTVNNAKAPLLMVSPGQINAQMPFEITGAATLVLHTPGGSSAPYTVTVAGSAPAVFRTATAGPETGLPAIYRALNGEPVTPTNPVHPGDYLVIYATGLGKTSPQVETGAPGTTDPLAYALEAPRVSLGGTQLPVLYAGLVPGLVGVYQINVFVPPSVIPGRAVPLVISRPVEDLVFNVRVVE